MDKLCSVFYAVFSLLDARSAFHARPFARGGARTGRIRRLGRLFTARAPREASLAD